MLQDIQSKATTELQMRTLLVKKSQELGEKRKKERE